MYLNILSINCQSHLKMKDIIILHVTIFQKYKKITILSPTLFSLNFRLHSYSLHYIWTTKLFHVEALVFKMF